jgi:deoxyribodipyrimidine photolyase-related protein
MNIFILFPNTLFKDTKLIDNLIKNKKIKMILVIEEPTFFTKFNYHKKKIILHRASMKCYYDFLLINYGTMVKYIDYKKEYLTITKKYNVHCYDPIDHTILKKLKSNSIELNVYDNLSFNESYQDLVDYKNTVEDNKFRHDIFYKWNRKRLNVLMDEKSKPLFGKWSFDKENRNPFNKTYSEPSFYPTNYFNKNIKEYIEEATDYVNKNFNNNFGSDEDFFYPITHLQALKLFKYFLKDKIKTYGMFQDAVSEDIIIGSHSFLSSSLNIGLITAETCLKLTLDSFYELDSKERSKYINNYEGYIRQLIGWRSYMRLLYQFHGKEMYQMNFFNHTKKITKDWYTGSTNIFPIDCLIKKVYKYAYLHHIERLMYIGNWALLTEISPKEIYKWFMVTCIDAYEWVMIPNVHGMSQFALDNSISMMTRPYFSSTNYLKRMSDLVKKDEEWTITWNNLYYYFIYKNRDYLKLNYSIAMQVKFWDNKSEIDKKNIIKESKKYLKN